MLFFYNLFIALYQLGVRIASFKSTKATLWLEGRKNIFNKLQVWRNELPADSNIIWVHCASLGEFEQGRPVIEALKKDYPLHKILLTFFSPSGYEIRKHYPQADGVFYLPIDGKRNAQRFLEIVQPALVIWVKYEYWYYYLTTLKTTGVPVLLVSAFFRASQPFFKWYGGLWKKVLQSFETIFVQNASSIELLTEIKLAQNAVIAGDTRFDRVVAVAATTHSLPELVIQFCANSTVIVAGSTWEDDEEVLKHFIVQHPHIKFIIAPHEIDEEHLFSIKKILPQAVFYTTLKQHDVTAQVLVIDNIGMLASLYKIATIAYIGGGFNDSGIHNILEAAVYGIPVVFGPEYHKFSEALALVQQKGAFSVETALELENTLNDLLINTNTYDKACNVNKAYVLQNKGATEKIMSHIYAKRLLTN